MTTFDAPIAAAPSEGLSENARAWMLFFAMVFSFAILFVALAGCFGKVGYVAASRAIKFYAVLGIVGIIFMAARAMS